MQNKSAIEQTIDEEIAKRDFSRVNLQGKNDDQITMESALAYWNKTVCDYCNKKYQALLKGVTGGNYCGHCIKNFAYANDTMGVAVARANQDVIDNPILTAEESHWSDIAHSMIKLEANKADDWKFYEKIIPLILDQKVAQPIRDVTVDSIIDVFEKQDKVTCTANEEGRNYYRWLVIDELNKVFDGTSLYVPDDTNEDFKHRLDIEEPAKIIIDTLATDEDYGYEDLSKAMDAFFDWQTNHRPVGDPKEYALKFLDHVEKITTDKKVEEEKFQEKTTVEVKPLHVPKPKKHKISWLELRAMINNWHIDSKQKYVRLVKKGILKGAPKDPSVYNEFKGWNDFLAEKSIKSVKKTPKQLSKDQLEKAMDSLKANWSFYESIPDGWFYEVFDMWGLFKSNDPYYNKFFNQFIALRQTPAGRQQLFEAISEKNFDMIAGHYPKGAPNQASIALFESTKVVEVKNQTVDPALLRSDKEIGVHKILSHAENIFPISEDDPVFDLHKSVLVKSLWTEMFESDEKKERKQWAQIMAKRKSGKDTLLKRRVIQQFRDEYTDVTKIRTNLDKCEYRGVRANLMQVYVAYMLKKKKGFCNFSRTGTGKTKSAIISSRITKSKRTLVLCPKAIDEQWKTMITDDYPESTVSVGNKVIFPPVISEKDYRYHVINYEKFSYDESADKIIEAVNAEPVDLVIVDEAQNIKQRIDHTKPDEEFTFQDQKDMSARKRNVEKMVNLLRAKNPKCKMLVLTATPVINNVTEGAKLLELVAGNKFDNLNYENTVRNASRLYTEFKEYSIRYNKKYNIKENKGGEYDIKVSTTIPSERSNEEIRKMHYSTFEQMCTVDRIPEMIKIAKNRGGKIIIYTDYVTGIVEPIKEAFELETNPATGRKFRVGLYTGSNKSGLKTPTAEKNVYFNPFKNGDLDILIASTPIAEGVDGLQHVCNTIIFNGLTWTFAKYEQIVGRLVRTGQRSKEVNIYRMLSSIEGYEYDQKIKVDRLHRKQLLQECVLDGRTPDLGAWDKQTAKEKREMLESVILNRQSRVRTKNQIRKDIRAGKTA